MVVMHVLFSGHSEQKMCRKGISYLGYTTPSEDNVHNFPSNRIIDFLESCK
jgi:hypothetical protein